MAKQLAYDAEARSALKRGVDKVADAVRITIGPKGRNVVLDKKFGSPTITNDADDHERRRHDCEGDRAGGRLREHGRTARQRSRQQDERRRG